MTARDEKYRVKYVAAVQPHVEGEVRAVGLFSQPGTMGAAVASQASPLVSTIMRILGKSKAGGLPMNVIIAATDDSVYAFDFKPRGTGVKIKDTAAVWDRGSVQVAATNPGTIADRLQISLGEGGTIELDSHKFPGFETEFNDPLIRLLGG